mmetsp:Transcript_83669/g.167063  ORF Transcript_83669/g.167063 Transcript_83669/m.167063 type:complete len:278 (-) Transcript_83669:352-1185(-)
MNSNNGCAAHVTHHASEGVCKLLCGARLSSAVQLRVVEDVSVRSWGDATFTFARIIVRFVHDVGLLFAHGRKACGLLFAPHGAAVVDYGVHLGQLDFGRIPFGDRVEHFLLICSHVATHLVHPVDRVEHVLDRCKGEVISIDWHNQLLGRAHAELSEKVHGRVAIDEDRHTVKSVGRQLCGDGSDPVFQQQVRCLPLCLNGAHALGLECIGVRALLHKMSRQTCDPTIATEQVDVLGEIIIDAFLLGVDEECALPNLLLHAVGTVFAAIVHVLLASK